jgi:hypothetical protein
LLLDTDDSIVMLCERVLAATVVVVPIGMHAVLLLMLSLLPATTATAAASRFDTDDGNDVSIPAKADAAISSGVIQQIYVYVSVSILIFDVWICHTISVIVNTSLTSYGTTPPFFVSIRWRKIIIANVIL